MTRSTWSRLAFGVLSLAWLFLVLVNYYIVHKPFAIENLLGLCSTMVELVAAAALYILAATLGRWLFRRLEFDSPLEELVFQTGAGLGVISFVTLALGLAGLLNPLLFWALLLGVLVLLSGDLRAMWKALRKIELPRATRLERGLFTFVAVALVASFSFALTPPTAWDSLQYHLVGPQLALRQGRIAAPPDNVALNYPGLVEMLFLAAMTLKDDVAAQLMHWGYLPLLLGAVMVYARRYFTVQHGWFAAAILCAVPAFLVTSTWAYNDVALTFYAVSALFFTLRAREKQDLKLFGLAGVFAGLAMGEKYTAPLVVAALLICIVRRRRETLIQGFVLCASAGLIAAPWYLRNWFFTGNPIYPFIWGGPYWDTFRAAWFSRVGSGLFNQPLALLIAPWNATVGTGQAMTGFPEDIGPLVLILLPLWLLTALWQGRQAPAQPARSLWIFAGVLYIAWLAGVGQSKLLQQTRFLFPAFPAMALLAADSFERLALINLPRFSLQRFASLVITLVLALTGTSYGLSLLADHPFTYQIGSESRSDYVARHLGDYDKVVNWVNTQLPPDAQVLLLWETRDYYFQRATVADPMLDRLPHLCSQYHTAGAIADYLHRAGFTHLVLYREGLDSMWESKYDPITAEDMRVLDELTTRHARRIYGIARPASNGLTAQSAPGESYTVYEILPNTAN